MRIVIKVGTQSILSNEGLPLTSIIEALVNQISELQKDHHIILVSSGAVGSGRKLVRSLLRSDYGETLGEKQVLASIGQPELIRTYTYMFQAHGILVSQLLLTKQDFHTRSHYLNIARLLDEILRHRNIIAVVNENDSVAVEELMFTDNDELAGLIAAQVNADKLIILSNVKGVYNKCPEAEDAQFISILDPQQNLPAISKHKSAQGRGGMISKIKTASKVAKLGITTHIASINEISVLKRIINGEEVGTTVIATRKQPSIKRWMAYNFGYNYSNQYKGAIFINSCLLAILKGNKEAVSLLPIGIVKCLGNFQKGDLVEVLSLDKEKIAVGLARYDKQKLEEYCGYKNKPAFIHYDYLHIF